MLPKIIGNSFDVRSFKAVADETTGRPDRDYLQCYGITPKMKA